MVEPLTQLYHKFLTVSSVCRQKYNKSCIFKMYWPHEKGRNLWMPSTFGIIEILLLHAYNGFMKRKERRDC